jgi:phosphoglycolate phosphatase
MKYKLIIFDFDGTLADTFPWFVNAINNVADTYRFKRIDNGDIDTIRGYSAKRVLKHLKIPFWKVPLIAKHMKTLMAKDTSKIELFTSVDLMLQQLSTNNVQIALVSSNSYDNISQILGFENLSLIDFHECSVSIFGKPSNLRRILIKSGVDRNEAIYIGDEIRDIEAANKVNMSSGAVSWGYNTIEKLKEKLPDEIFYAVNEIPIKLA